jgi:carnitine 3-dehydrogenase
VAIQQVLRPFNIGAGATLRALEERLYEDRAAALAAAPGAPQATVLQVTGNVRPEWVDYNGHMTDSRYQQVFGEGMDALYRRVGVDESYRAGGHMFYTVETHTTHQAEMKAGESYYLGTRVLSVDAKRLRVFHRMHRQRDGLLVATGEQLNMHVAVAAAKSAPMPQAIYRQLEALRAAHAAEPLPPEAGRHVGQARS